MQINLFDSAETTAAYLTAQHLDIIYAGCDRAPLASVPTKRQRWYKHNHHSHHHREILIPLSGQNICGIAGTFYEACPGRAFFFDRDIKHEIEYPEQVNSVQHLWVSLLAESATAYVYDTQPQHDQPHVLRRVLLRYRSIGINPEQLWDSHGAEHTHVAFLRIIAETFLLRWFDVAEEQFVQTDSIEHQQQMVEAVKAHIENTAGRDASLDQMAKLAGYSKFHFLRLFKEHAQCTLLEYIDDCRRKRAVTMLGAGYSHRQIAEDLGFSGSASFSRWKKKHLI